MIASDLTIPLSEADIAGCIGSDHDEAARLKNRLARQLLATMRREERLREAMNRIYAIGQTVSDAIDAANRMADIAHETLHSPNDYPATSEPKA